MAFNIPFGGGGSSFRVEDRVTGTIAPGVTGDILSLAVTGKVIRLYLLSCQSTSAQTGISIVRDGFTVADQEFLAASTPGSQMVVSRVFTSSQLNSTDLYFDVIDGESIVINKNAGNTTQTIVYAYEVGSFQ